MRRLLLALLLACATWAQAAPYAVQLGAERVVLDAAPGFSDTTFLASPRLQELAESLTPASNRILLFALTDADLRRFSSGDTPELLRYLLVATPRALERNSVGLSEFRAFAAEAVRGLGDPMAPGDLRAFLDTRPIGQPSLVRELRRTPLFVSLLIATRLPPRTETEPQYLLHTTTLMLVRGKALSVSTYTRYRDAGDADWLLDATLRWTAELQRLNGR